MDIYVYNIVDSDVYDFVDGMIHFNTVLNWYWILIGTTILDMCDCDHQGLTRSALTLNTFSKFKISALVILV